MIKLNKDSVKKFAFNLTGGFTAAVISIPGSIVYGMIAFSPLGPEYIHLGIQAGLYCTIFLGLFSSFFVSTKGMISGTEGPNTLIFSSLLAALLSSGIFALNQPGSVQQVITIAFFTVFLAGIIQLLFSFFKIGRLIKFISYPVISGFRNGTAVLIVLSQVKSVLNSHGAMSVFSFLDHISTIDLLTYLVTGITILTIVAISKISKKIPSSLAGLLVGTILYYSFNYFGITLGETISRFSIGIPSPDYVLPYINLITDKQIFSILLAILPAAFTIAIIGSVDTLLTAQSMESLTNRRSDSDKDLLGQGVGNIITSLFGGIPGAGIPGRSFINFNTGGKSRLSGILFGILFFLLIYFLSPVIRYIPNIIMSGVIIAIAFRIFDSWTFFLIKELFSKEVKHKHTYVSNLLLIFAVMVITIVFNLITAVVAGLCLSMLLQIMRMSKSIIKREYFGTTVHSKKQRDYEKMSILTKYGHTICVLELEGYIFFGTADKLATDIEHLLHTKNVTFLILDMKRIKEIDETGAKIIQRIYTGLISQDKLIVISYIRKQSELWHFLKQVGFFKVVDEHSLFFDTNSAMEWCEELLIINKYEDNLDESVVTLEHIKVLEGLSSREYNTLRGYLTRVEFNQGRVIFKQGEAGDAMYFILKGAVDVNINLSGNQKKKLITLTKGTIFGEMALLDNNPRSANVEVNEDLICFRLSLENFYRLKQEHPKIAMTFLTNISLTFSMYLRNANKIISELEA